MSREECVVTNAKLLLLKSGSQTSRLTLVDINCKQCTNQLMVNLFHTFTCINVFVKSSFSYVFDILTAHKHCFGSLKTKKKCWQTPARLIMRIGSTDQCKCEQSVAAQCQ